MMLVIMKDADREDEVWITRNNLFSVSMLFLLAFGINPNDQKIFLASLMVLDFLVENMNGGEEQIIFILEAVFPLLDETQVNLSHQRLIFSILRHTIDKIEDSMTVANIVPLFNLTLLEDLVNEIVQVENAELVVPLRLRQLFFISCECYCSAISKFIIFIQDTELVLNKLFFNSNLF